MKVGLIGLGRMGYHMALQLAEKGIRVIAYDIDKRSRGKINEERNNSIHVESKCAMVVSSLSSPRIILISVPAGKTVDDIIRQIKPKLKKDDVVADCGNSLYHDSQRRYKELKLEGIAYLDVGMSGGLYGARHGASIMVSGDFQHFETARPVLEHLACQNGLHYVGSSGRAHRAKMIHNGIEYGIMQAIAEGVELLRMDKSTDLEAVIESWCNGSILSSALINYAAQALNDHELMEKIDGFIGGGVTGAWALEEAELYDVDFSTLRNALVHRYKSKRNRKRFAYKLVAAIRNKFGGHEIVEHE